VPSHSDKNRVTIADIATEAKVSVPTVSKVLNGRPEVSASTRDRVERLIAKHGYTRRTRQTPQRAGLVDLVFTDLDSEWAVEIIRGVEEVAQHAAIGTVVSAIHGRSTTTRKWLDNLAARRSDGVILTVSELDSGETERVRALGVPVVIIDPGGEPDPDIPSVGATNWRGALAATAHLQALGHQRIALISGPARLQCSRARRDGYCSAMTAAGLPVPEEFLREGDFSHEAGERAAHHLLELPCPPTALFAGNDQQALGAYQAIRDRGLRIPEDISVVGFDDLPLARWASPPLTTIRQPLPEMAAHAMRMLLHYLDKGQFETLRLELATELVQRGSTAACPGT
jgi:LacI family transcriptional regulator